VVSHLVVVVGLCTDDPKELTKPVRADLLHVTSAYVLVSASQLSTAL